MNDLTLIPILDKYSISEEDTLRVSQSILNGNLVIKYRYIPIELSDKDDRLKFTPKKFNWIMELEEHTNMGMLHLHSLEPISYLLSAYRYTLNSEYLDKSLEILFDWYDHSRNSKHFYLWYRHCVADRAVIVSQLFFLKNKLGLNENQNEILYKIFFEHREYLINNENYISHNHGVLMDIGLISLSLVSGDKASQSYAIRRLVDNFEDTFTGNMVCVENSISYSVYNIEQLIKCEKYLLNPMDISLIPEFDMKINKALDFLEIVKQPDNSFPHIGDGEKIDLDYLKGLHIYKHYNSHKLFGKIEDYDTCYDHNVYYDEGYAVIKNNSNYIFITAGDVKKNHKHADDLSFVLYLNGEVFIDPGIYSYQDNELRRYLTSSLAHNTVTLNKQSYDYIRNNVKDTLIVKFEEHTEYYYILMSNKSYNHAIIYRHLYIFKEDFTLFIRDEVISRTIVLATQHFNLSPELSNISSLVLEKNQLVINQRVKLQFDNNSYYEVFNGRDPYSVNAIYSQKFQQKEPIIKIAINNYDKSPILQTVISGKVDTTFNFIGDTKNTDTIKVEHNEKTLLLKKHDVSEKAKSQLESKVSLDLIQKGDVIYGETFANYFEKQEYAWDILRDGEKEDLIWYQDSSKFKYQLKVRGSYKIRCYIRNKENTDEKKAFVSPQIITF